MTIQEILRELDQEAASTRRALERVPEDRLEWRPHEKSMTLGQLAMHIATIPGRIADLARESSFEARGDTSRPETESRERLLAAFDESLAHAREVIGGMSDADLGETWRMTRGGSELMAMPRAAVLRTILLNHWYHHRGQLTVYLRELDVPVPAIYGPSADEPAFTDREG